MTKVNTINKLRALLAGSKAVSDFREGNFGDNYNLTYIDGPIRGLLARSIIVLNENGDILHTEQVHEVVEEPNYKAALEALYD